MYWVTDVPCINCINDNSAVKSGIRAIDPIPNRTDHSASSAKRLTIQRADCTITISMNGISISSAMRTPKAWDEEEHSDRPQ
jgi:hypothetical protein